MAYSPQTSALPAIAVVAALVSACSDGSGGTVIEVQKGVTAFIPAEIRIPVNKPATITLSNQDKTIHDWTIDAIEVGGKPEKVVLTANPNQRTANNFVFSKTGTYNVYCSQPGRKEAGMIGKVIVE